MRILRSFLTNLQAKRLGLSKQSNESRSLMGCTLKGRSGAHTSLDLSPLPQQTTATTIPDHLGVPIITDQAGMHTSTLSFKGVVHA